MWVACETIKRVLELSNLYDKECDVDQFSFNQRIEYIQKKMSEGDE